MAEYTCNMKEPSVQSAAPHRVLKFRWPFPIGDRYLEGFLFCRDRTSKARGEREGKQIEKHHTQGVESSNRWKLLCSSSRKDSSRNMGGARVLAKKTQTTMSSASEGQSLR